MNSAVAARFGAIGSRLGWAAAVLLAAFVFYVGINWGSTTAGGADSYGYVSQAGLWLNGQLTVPHELVRQSPWPNAGETWAPLGYRASPQVRDELVPLYAPGLPLLMALAQAVGGFCAAFLVIPLSGALTILATYVLALRVFGRPLVAGVAATLVASSPIFLYQLMNPMTDVPVTAAWTLALTAAVSGWPLAAGVLSSVALLIRPNLVLVALAIAGWLWLTRARVWRYLLGAAPAAMAVGLLNTRFYGSALTSGYGSFGELYALGHFTTNLRQFSGWLFETDTPVVLLVGVYFVRPSLYATTPLARPRLLLGGFVVAVLASYLFYQPFDAWWYLRFLLPIWPIVMMLVPASIDAIMPLAPTGLRSAAVALVGLGLAVHGVGVARTRHAFDIGRFERRYIDVGRFVSSHTDPSAVMIALQHSGTLRLYGGRLTLRFDQLDPAWLDRAIAFLQASGRHPYIVVEAGEQQLFAERFAGLSETGKLAWRPYARLDTADISIYDAVEQKATGEPLAIGASSRRAGWRCDPPQDWVARRGTLGVR